MKPTALLPLALTTALFAADQQVILNLEKSPHAKILNTPIPATTITEGFWSGRRKINVDRSIPTMLELLEEHGTIDNFRRLVGKKDVGRKGPVYTDSDIYKWMEAVAFVLAGGRNPKLEEQFDKYTDEIVAVQEPTGYLNTYYQDDKKNLRFEQMDRGHELYCLGHMLQAAIAYERATGKRKLLDSAIKYVNYLITDFGPGKHPLLTGHPELEMALVELYRTTGERKYLDLAGYLLHGDGERLKLRESQLVYMFSGKPFTDRTQMEGHAVRAGYACSGATDYYLETGDPKYKATLDKLWNDLVTTKMYITGGIGSRAAGEAFGDPYELPNSRAYTESCAAIANMMWNWRMLAATAEAKYTDVLELALYNSVNSGMSLDGTLYCYRNPLEANLAEAKTIRNPWYETICCPPNIERVFASLPGYFYGSSKDGIYVHLYDNNQFSWHLNDGTPIKIQQVTKYPWEGKVELTVTPQKASDFTLYVRVPGWSRTTQATLGGKAINDVKAGSYLPIKRRWNPGDKVVLNFDMTPQVLVSNPRVMENQGRVAVKRGPIVYAMEQTDQQDNAPVLDAGFKLTSEPLKDFRPEYRSDLLGGVTVLHHKGLLVAQKPESLPLYMPVSDLKTTPGQAVDLTLIPYYSFLNRGPAPIEVWAHYWR